MHHATASPIALEALERIAALFTIESSIRGRPSDQRGAAEEHARPLLAQLKTFLDTSLNRVSGKSALPKRSAIPVALAGAGPIVTDGRLEMSNNGAERAMKPPGPWKEKLSVPRLPTRRRWTARRLHPQRHLEQPYAARGIRRFMPNARLCSVSFLEQRARRNLSSNQFRHHSPASQRISRTPAAEIYDHGTAPRPVATQAHSPKSQSRKGPLPRSKSANNPTVKLCRIMHRKTSGDHLTWWSQLGVVRRSGINRQDVRHQSAGLCRRCLSRIADHPIRQIDTLLPWRWSK